MQRANPSAKTQDAMKILENGQNMVSKQDKRTQVNDETKFQMEIPFAPVSTKKGTSHHSSKPFRRT